MTPIRDIHITPEAGDPPGARSTDALPLDSEAAEPDAAHGAAERRRLLRELEMERARLHQIFSQVPALISVTRGPNHVFELVNPAYQHALGPREVVGKPLREALPELEGQGYFELRDALYATGRTHVQNEARVLADLDADGRLEEHFLNFVTQPLRDADGEVDGLLTFAVDVTEHVRVRQLLEEQAAELEVQAEELQSQANDMVQVQAELENANRRLRERAAEAEAASAAAATAATRLEVLSQAGAVLGSSLDVAGTLAQLAQLVVPKLADWCFVEMPDGTGKIEAVVVHHSDPERARFAAEAMRRYPIDPQAPYGTAQVLRTGEPDLVSDLPPELLRAVAQDAEHLQLLESVGFRSYISLPLEVRGRTLGVLSLVMAESGQRFSEADLPFVRELARRAALAVDNSRLYAAERDARTAAEHAADRSRRLQAVAAALNGAATPAEVAAVCVEHGRDALDASHGSLALLMEGDAGFEVVHTSYPTSVAERWQRFPFNPAKPLSAAVARRWPVLLGSVAEWEAQFPGTSGDIENTGIHAFAAVPLYAGEQAMGGLAFSFVSEQCFTEADRTFLITLGEQAAQALERARLLEAERSARTEAEAANRAKAEFLSAMSHELRTPLNAIAGYVDLLDAGVRGTLSDAQRSDLERIKRAQNVLLGLINDILNFARVEAGRIEFRRDAVPALALVADLESIIRPQVHAKGLQFLCDTCPAGLTVLGDSERIQQVLTNLLANAVKFTGPGGKVVLRVDAEGDRVVFRVIDTGRGIPADRLSDIFEPFVQLDRQNSEESQQGVGLGLAISRELARAMNGELTAESTFGAGSTFVLSLPAGGASVPE